VANHGMTVPQRRFRSTGRWARKKSCSDQPLQQRWSAPWGPSQRPLHKWDVQKWRAGLGPPERGRRCPPDHFLGALGTNRPELL